ncbi:hypothetical protein D3Z48_16630 [Clostridiaceae bacterium]|nr:hypothetical protein [Clostridiaceae bacterium]
MCRRFSQPTADALRRRRALPCTRPYAGSGRALPCTRDFFGKKSSKNFIPPAGGTGEFAFLHYFFDKAHVILSHYHEKISVFYCKIRQCLI